MYVKDRSNRIVTTVGQKNKLESPTEFNLSTKPQTQLGKGSVH